MIVPSTIDSYKKGKLLFSAVLTGFLVLVLKLVQSDEIASVSSVYIFSALVAIFAYISLLWSLKFQVSWKTLVFILSQASIFVFNQTLFVELFLFRRVGRIYEVLILLLTLLVITGLTYVSFATANIFNVAQFKEIPLVQVGKTSSFILTLLSIFFITFAVIESNLFFPLTVFLCSLMYFALIVLHLRHLDVKRRDFWKISLMTILAMAISLILVLIIGRNTIFMSLTPLVVFYSMIGLQTSQKTSLLQFSEYFIFTLASILANFLV